MRGISKRLEIPALRILSRIGEPRSFSEMKSAGGKTRICVVRRCQTNHTKPPISPNDRLKFENHRISTQEQVKRGVDPPTTGSSKNASTANSDQARENETWFDSIADTHNCRGQPNAKDGAQVLANPTSSPSLTISSPAAERSGSFALHDVDDRGGGEIGVVGGGGGGGLEVRHLTGVGK